MLSSNSMGIIRHFTDVIAWQKSKEITLFLYRKLSHSKDYGYVDQIRRASLSIMNNIAEGYGRYGGREFRQFLAIAKGSNMEVKSMIYLGNKLEYFDDSKQKELLALTEDIDHLLKALIKSILIK